MEGYLQEIKYSYMVTNRRIWSGSGPMYAGTYWQQSPCGYNTEGYGQEVGAMYPGNHRQQSLYG